MDQSTFDNFVRRSAELLNRRSLFGGLSAALLGIGGMPTVLEAKKKGKGKKKRNKERKKRVKECRRQELPGCEPTDSPDCPDVVNQCCKKACKSNAKA